MPALSKYNPEYHDDWAWSLALKGATDDEMAAAFGISRRTFLRWRKEHESFDEAIERGKNAADAKVEKSLYQRALGYTVTDEEKVVEMDQDGNVKPIRIKTIKKHITPDTMAMMYWLNNRSRKYWNQRQEIAVDTNEDGVDVRIYLPENGRDKNG